MRMNQILPGMLLHVVWDTLQPYDVRILSMSTPLNRFLDYMIDDIVLRDTCILVLAVRHDPVYDMILVITESKRTCVLLLAKSWSDAAALEPVAVTS